ncbi:hypothetical protein [Chrysiogenes arsenatis]|uniref:hypothetical protein n=1 Tax=Chrysiogenes arsenatis TaxID=309797 RepID=UPI000411C9AF|nr:hypothetical protein [Chrysiogenes arsenatis]
MAGNQITLDRYPHLGWYDGRRENERGILRDTGSREVIMVLADHLFFPIILTLPPVEKSRREAIARSELRAQYPITPQHAVMLFSMNNVDLAFVSDTSLIRTEERVARSSGYRPVAVLCNAATWLLQQVQLLPAGQRAEYRGGVTMVVERHETGKFQIVTWQPLFEAESPLDHLTTSKPIPDFSVALEKRPSFLSRLPKGNQIISGVAIAAVCLLVSFGLSGYAGALVNDASKKQIETLWSGAFPGERVPVDPVGILLSRIRSASGNAAGSIAPHTSLSTLSLAFSGLEGITLQEVTLEDGKVELVGRSATLVLVDALMEKLAQLDIPLHWRLLRADSTSEQIEFRITGGRS